MSSSDPAYAEAIRWLWGAVHELPAGVLWGADGATSDQCAEMMDGLDELARLVASLGLSGHEEFIDGCRWHFEHWPHYLERRRHFVDYATYVAGRGGPLTVSLPS